MTDRRTLFSDLDSARTAGAGATGCVSGRPPMDSGGGGGGGAGAGAGAAPWLLLPGWSSRLLRLLLLLLLLLRVVSKNWSALQESRKKNKNIVILKERNPISRRKAWLNDCFWQNVIRTEFTVAAQYHISILFIGSFSAFFLSSPSL